jgi:hypothetical protein
VIRINSKFNFHGVRGAESRRSLGIVRSRAQATEYSLEGLDWSEIYSDIRAKFLMLPFSKTAYETCCAMIKVVQ